MRVLCCLDGTNLEKLQKAAAMLSRQEPLCLGLLYVIDAGPREGISRMRERFLRRPGPTFASRDQQMRQSETRAAEEILRAASDRFPGSETLAREGHPEREIVNSAAQWQADLVLIDAQVGDRGKPAIGPKSVGHVARFVVDHAPCPVLLMRPATRAQIPPAP